MSTVVYTPIFTTTSYVTRREELEWVRRIHEGVKSFCETITPDSSGTLSGKTSAHLYDSVYSDVYETIVSAMSINIKSSVISVTDEIVSNFEELLVDAYEQLTSRELDIVKLAMKVGTEVTFSHIYNLVDRQI